MRTHGHKERNITHHGLLRGERARGGIALGEIPNVDDRVMETANHHGTCVPMLQTCTFCTRTPVIKRNLNKEFLHSKRNYHQSKQAGYKMGKNFCIPSIWQSANIQNLQTTYTNLQEKEINPSKSGQRIWMDTSQKKTFMHPTNIWKNAHHHWSSEKCKSKPQWDTISQ